MTDPHRTNMLVTSCLRTPVDPHKKTPLALYERQRLLPRADEDMDKRDYEKEEVHLYALVPCAAFGSCKIFTPVLKYSCIETILFCQN